jgi:HTH-type transcriptional regulator/antitoxin HipB
MAEQDFAIPVRSARDIGVAIRASRRRQRLGQAALAERAGVSRQWIIELEKGKSSAELGLVLRTLTALGVGLVLIPASPISEQSFAAGTPDLDAIIDHARGGGR